MFDKPDDPWEIIPFAYGSEPGQFVDAPDRWTVEEFLRQFQADYAVMTRFRELLSPSDPVSRFADDEVAALLTARLVARELMLRTAEPPTWTAQASSGGGGSAAGQSASGAPSSGRSVSTPKSEEPDPVTFSGDHDAPAQAASLAAAAAAGSPFCEECAKSRGGAA